MRYDIFSSTAPAMPKPSKGTETCKLLLSQASKDMRETLVPMSIPVLAAHLSYVKFMYSDNKYYELCGQMGHLIGPSLCWICNSSVSSIRICNPFFRIANPTKREKCELWAKPTKCQWRLDSI